MAIRILGISGSPILGGNCDKMVQLALKAAEDAAVSPGEIETEFIPLADRKIEMCEACQYCVEHKVFCKKTDDAYAVFQRMAAADGIIVGGPTWGWTVCPLIPLLLTRGRFYNFFPPYGLRNKVCGAVTVGWHGRGCAEALGVIETELKSALMIPVARAMAVTSTAAYGQTPKYLEHGALDDRVGVKWVKNVGLRVVEVTRLIKTGQDAGGQAPPEFCIITSGATMAVPKKQFVAGVWTDKVSA
ncbi:MAG: flavodoxin family protein [Chloroflexi bacterium]|nr:flavodoxin family protein [Chloroflexota bacterium]